YEKVLVTGAAGFIGRTLVQMLADRGYHVTALDNFRFSNKDQVTTHANVRWVTGDTRDWTLVEGLVSEVDAVIHLAAPSSFLMHEENDLEACNFTIMGFKTVMEAVRKHKIPKVVWASTSAVYEGNPLLRKKLFLSLTRPSAGLAKHNHRFKHSSSSYLKIVGYISSHRLFCKAQKSSWRRVASGQLK
ncbi:MAG: NAD-dependent epimerase/dehydratase family protein, partial [Deltaproteobacteria bacterium]|nr:NAD-dependent epimerase/dehydratase family protein [Deltaproteobacteria bacterium]